MKRPILNLMFAVVLAMCTIAGVATPAGAAPDPDRSTNGEQFIASQSGGVATIDGSTAMDTNTDAKVERWIEVILSQRRLLAHEGNRVIMTSIVSIGKPSTPTVRGTFRIYSKLRATRMSGPGYNLPNVPHTMYFFRGFAIHGAYWVKKFGGMVSHGCVNVNLADAAWLFNWAPVGTRVVIH